MGAVLAGLLLAASAAACDSGAGAARSSVSNTVATEPAPTTTTNPYAVPAVIDEAYVNRVLAGLDAAIGDVVRLVYSARTIPPDAVSRLRALYGNDQVLQLFLDGLQIDLRSGFRNYRPQIGNKSSVVTQLVSARPECIFAQVHRDYSAISTDTSAVVNPQWVALKPATTGTASFDLNPTNWILTYDGFTRTRAQPENPCAP